MRPIVSRRSGLLLLLSLSVGCLLDKTECASACDRLYQPSECAIVSPGKSTNELLEQCTETCVEAMKDRDGELGDYDPSEQADRTSAITIENRAQAEVWFECIDTTSCAQISDGYCAPVF